MRPNYLSGQFGGITLEQWERIKRVDGVDIAAPIAMLGYAPYWRHEEVDITDMVERSLDRQVIQLTATWISDRGLTQAPDTPTYVYVTKNELIYAEVRDGQPYFPDGRRMPDDCVGPLERMPGGRTLPICGTQSGR